MTPADLLVDALGRTAENVGSLLADVTDAELVARPTPDANTIAWLVWHLTRVQDDHVADVAGTEQVWTAQGYADRFGLPFDPREHGYGHTSDQVAHPPACWRSTTARRTTRPSPSCGASASRTSTASSTSGGTRR